ncbi:NucA/NucB deoxyribonuclease domain-containing protein [Streptomyces sp. NPDC058249]|uniref:NucA/NucB deoxyribonuclease domain-containing protein n=1 Tax=Streptomyces sp. NPDC058249 TaxID=3346403 RepID=UPI0036E72A47
MGRWESRLRHRLGGLTPIRIQFPFASTKEGAGLGDGNFSVRYVPGTENEQAGRELGTWYGSGRILHGNAYRIYVK